jgi:peptidoglycan/LPS O-acetylase OafA/YrhL
VPETAVESPNLDLLRATAVLTVFLAHLLIGLGVKPREEVGAAGVLIFFVHTSLVLMMSLSRLESRGESLVKRSTSGGSSASIRWRWSASRRS